jgi:hypothetical protein
MRQPRCQAHVVMSGSDWRVFGGRSSGRLMCAFLIYRLSCRKRGTETRNEDGSDVFTRCPLLHP